MTSSLYPVVQKTISKLPELPIMEVLLQHPRTSISQTTMVPRLFSLTRMTEAYLSSDSTASWMIAGLTNIADWVGSNRDRFPYCEPDVTLAGYWPDAQKKAADAVVAAGILPSWVSNEPNAGRPRVRVRSSDVSLFSMHDPG